MTKQKRSRQALLGFATALGLTFGSIVFAATSNKSITSSFLRNNDQTLHRRLLGLPQFIDPKTVTPRTDFSTQLSSTDTSRALSDDPPAAGAGGRPTFVFLIGLEGVGHHLVDEMMGKSPNMRAAKKLGMCSGARKGGRLSLLERLMFDMGGNGLFNPRSGAGLSRYNSEYLYNEIVSILNSVDRDVADYRSKATAPFYVPINSNNCMNLSMMSFPNYKGENRVYQSVNLDTYYRACRDAGVECRHAYMYRDPYRILQSTLRRDFNADDLDGIRLYTMELQIIYAQMSYYAEKNLGCFGFLDAVGSKRMEDIDRFGKIFGWTSGFRNLYNKMNNKELLPMTEQEKQEMVPVHLSPFMKSYIEIHERVVDLCYSTINE